MNQRKPNPLARIDPARLSMDALWQAYDSLVDASGIETNPERMNEILGQRHRLLVEAMSRNALAGLAEGRELMAQHAA